jgi:hypothetical protein
VNEAEWEFGPDAGGLVVKTRTQRALGNGAIHISTAADVLADHRCSCVHGRTALRLK